MSDPRKPPLQADDSISRDSPHADRLRALLLRAGLGQRAAARLLGIDERRMRQWCAGQGAPPESVYRALSPKSAHLDDLRQRIELNEQVIDSLENGRFADLPHDYRPANEEAARQEIDHLRRCNEEHRSLLRLEEAIDWKRDAHAAVFEQWLPHGSGVPTDDSLDQLDAAEQEFQSAKTAVDRITERIRTGRWRSVR